MGVGHLYGVAGKGRRLAIVSISSVGWNSLCVRIRTEPYGSGIDSAERRRRSNAAEMLPLAIGDRVKVAFEAGTAGASGWYSGTIIGSVPGQKYGPDRKVR